MHNHSHLIPFFRRLIISPSFFLAKKFSHVLCRGIKELQRSKEGVGFASLTVRCTREGFIKIEGGREDDATETLFSGVHVSQEEGGRQLIRKKERNVVDMLLSWKQRGGLQ